MSWLSYSTSASYRGGLGILKVENGDLIFVKRGGILDQKDYVVQTIPLKAVRSVRVEGTIRRSLVITTDPTMHPGIPRHEFSVPSPEQWAAAIQNEMAEDKVKLAPSHQPTVVKEIVREIVKYPCPYCSALIEVTLSRCPSCGAPQRK